MNFDLIYGITTFIFNVITFAAILVIIRDYRNKNTIAQATRMFLDAKRFTLAFVFLLVSALFLTIGYAASLVIAISNPQTTFWEYTNLFVFLFIMLFFILFSGVYANWKIKRNISKPTSVEANMNALNQQRLDQPNTPDEPESASIPKLGKHTRSNKVLK